MNFLAHLYLSFRREELLIGNFAGDFLSNKQVELLPEAFQRGVTLHRLIDSYTDLHPEVKQCTLLLHPSQGKYSPVVMDIFFDFILYSQWDKYSDIPFIEFKERSYYVIRKHYNVFPKSAAQKALTMVNGDFLESYTSIEGLTFTFHRLEKRLKFPSNLAFATLDLKEHLNFFTQKFNIFFPELLKFTRDFILLEE